MKSILLFTSEKVGFTGTVSFSYIFQQGAKAYGQYPKHCRGPFGYAWKDREEDAAIPFNFFTSKGMQSAGAFGQNQEALILESMPEYSTMLCTKRIATQIKELMKDQIINKQLEVLEVYSEDTLLTNK